MLDTPAMASLELFLLRARARQKFLEIRLDQVQPLPQLHLSFWNYPLVPTLLTYLRKGYLLDQVTFAHCSTYVCGCCCLNMPESSNL